MVDFFKQNAGLILILALLAVALFFAVRYLVKQKKRGGCSGCSVSGCPHARGSADCRTAHQQLPHQK